MPPADKAAGWGGSSERVQNHKAVPVGCARRESPKRRENQGRVDRERRAKMGATRQPPPRRGTSAAPRACILLATCIRQRTDSKGAPPPSPQPTQERDEDSKETARGHGEGRRTDHNAGERDGRQAVKESPDRRGTAGTREHRKGRGKGETPGEEVGRQGPTQRTGGAGATRARKRHWQGTRPQGSGGPPGDRIGPT